MMMSVAGSQHRTKTALALEALREAISTRELGPDTRLTYAHLEQFLGMSATPIREAVRQLEAEGFLHVHPHRGIVVAEHASLSAADALGLYGIRSALESGATRMACDELDVDGLGKIRAIHEGMLTLQDVHDLRHANEQLHFAIYCAAGIGSLVDLIAVYWRRFPWDSIWELPGRPSKSLEQHGEILAALEAGEGAEAAELMHRHIISGRDLVVQSLGGAQSE